MFFTQFTFTHMLFIALASVGLTAILVDGKVFLPLRLFLLNRRETNPVARFLANILTCYQCCGFWSGVVCGATGTLLVGYASATLLGRIAAYPAAVNAGIVHEIPTAVVSLFPNAVTFLAFGVVVFGYGLIGSLLSLSYLVLVEWIHSHTIRPQEMAPPPEHAHEDGLDFGLHDKDDLEI